MLETALVAFATLFATVGPFDVAIIFASLTADQSPRQRMRMAVKGTVVATAILIPFAFGGELVLNLFGITLPAFRIAGGLLLFLIAIDLVFARHSGGTSITDEENKEATASQDISVFPLATPLIAGPGVMGALVLAMTHAEGHPVEQALVILALVGVMAVTLVCMLLTSQLQKYLGRTGVHVISRVFGVILAALAVQFVLDGLEGSGIL